MKRSLLMLIIALLAFGVVFANGGSEEGTKSSDPWVLKGDPALKGDVSWYLGGDSPFYYEIADAFMEEYSGINIEVMGTPWGEWSTKFVTMAAAGQMPDLIWFIAGQPGMRLNVANWKDDLLDLSPFLEQVSPADFIDTTLLEGAKVEGKLLGLPYEFNNIVLYYNKAMFDEEGLEYPNADWTWDDMLEAGRILTKDDGSQYGLYWNQFEELIALGGAGTPMFNENATDTNYHTREAKIAYEFLYDIYVKSGIAPKQNESTGVSLDAGTAAMEINGNWRFNTYKGAEIDFGSTLIPAGPAGHVTLQRENVWSVSKEAEDMAAALTFAEFLGFGEGLDRWAASGRLAPYKKYTLDSYLESTGVKGTAYEATFTELMNTVFDNAQYAMPSQVLPSWIDGGTYDQIINNNKYLMTVENLSIEDTLSNIKSEIKEYLDSKN